MSRWSVICPQCEIKIDIDVASSPTTNSSGELVAPHVIARRCERCVAWVRLEGWTEWTPSHYSMTPFRTPEEALETFPRGTWSAVADAAVQN